MPKFKFQIKSKAQISKIFWILNFDICLPAAGRDFENLALEF
jgi:hypothetical protein